MVDEAEVPRRPDARRGDERAEESRPCALAEELAARRRPSSASFWRRWASRRRSSSPTIGPAKVSTCSGRISARSSGGAARTSSHCSRSSPRSRRGKVGRTVHVPVDVEGYRRRREDQLREVALRVASRVRTSGQAVTLEPMLAYERRIVHLAGAGSAGHPRPSPSASSRTAESSSSPPPLVHGARRRRPRRAIPASGPGGFRPRPGGPPAGGAPYGPRRSFGPRPGAIPRRALEGRR